jgi:outer membrane lipoprotein LolB
MGLCLAMLAGCATLRAPITAPERLPDSERAAAEAAQAAREAALQGRTWDMTGRVALSNGRQGGSGRIEWRGDIGGDAYAVSLSAPVTRQSWRLSGEASGADLEGLDGGPRSGADPVALLREATGWDIPVRALSAWMVGARAPIEFGAATLEFAADHSLAGLVQGGWTVRYAGWRTGGSADVTVMPGRIEATRGDARVRLVVDDWAPVTPSPAQAAR